MASYERGITLIGSPVLMLSIAPPHNYYAGYMPIRRYSIFLQFDVSILSSERETISQRSKHSY